MTIASPGWLYPAYVANILVLVPICYAMFAGTGTQGVFEGMVADSRGLRLLVASLWLAILLASIAGLIWPAFFAPVLLIQIVYKTCWLLVFILPLIVAGQSWPGGISLTFLAIVTTYPVMLFLAVGSGK